MPDPFDYVYPLPEQGPLANISEWIPLLLAAVDAELDRDGVWNDDDLDTALGYVQDLKAWLAEFEPVTHPVGMIVPFAGSSAPDGWVLCEGQAVSRTAYAALFAVVGTAYGAGDGSTTFNLPDLRRRSPIGPGGAWSPGQQVGAETHTLTTNEMPAHSHPQRGSMLGALYHGVNGGSGQRTTLAQTTVNAYGYTLLVTADTGGGAAHNNVGPALVLNFMIRAV